MSDFIAKISIAFLCTVGILSLVQYFLNYYILRRKNSIKDICVVVLTKGRCQGAEYVIRALVNATCNINTKGGTPNILVVDDGLQEEACEICSLLEYDYESVKFCSKEQALKILKEDYIEKDVNS